MSEVNVFSEGLEQSAELETMYIPVYFDSLRGLLADVSPTKDQKGCGVGIWCFGCQPENILILWYMH